MATAGKHYFSSTRIAVLALFSALAGVLYIFNFALPFAFPSFLEFKFSDVPVLIGTFALGPLSGCIIVVMMVLIKLVCVSTTTMFVGDVADIIITIAFCLPAGLIYKKNRTFKGALAGMIVGSLVSIAVAIVANRVLLVPFYVEWMFGGSWDPILGMMTPLFPSCTVENFYTFYLWVSVLPFNALRCLVASLITIFVYKHISRAINRVNARLIPKGQMSARANGLKTAMIVVGIAIVVLLFVFFAVLRYMLEAFLGA